MTTNSEIVNALKAAREAKGLSQRALAARAGLPQSHISKIESGVVDLQLSSLTELARVLGLEVKLVPRRALPAVDSIVRQAGPESSRDRQAQVQQALRNLHALADRLAPYDRSLSLEQIRDATQLLQHVPPAADDLKLLHKALSQLKHLEKVGLDTHYEQDIEAVLDAPRVKRSLMNAARVLRDIRNRVAHAEPSGTGRPAYRLDEEESDG